jgi:hypothetical protein
MRPGLIAGALDPFIVLLNTNESRQQRMVMGLTAGTLGPCIVSLNTDKQRSLVLLLRRDVGPSLKRVQRGFGHLPA